MRFIAGFMVILLCFTGAAANACTTILVGSAASQDGGRIMGRTMDTPFLMPMQLVTVPAADGEGTWIFADEVNGLTVELPVRGYQYVSTRTFPSLGMGVNAESGVNSCGVCISATESIRTRDELVELDPFVDGGIAEQNIPTLIIPYVSTAREGVERLGELIAAYGSESAEAVIFADASEIWYMEIYTARQWAAMRMPEDCYAVIGNDAILGRADAADTQNVILSPDALSMPQRAGLLQYAEGLPHLAMTYGPELRDYSQARVWSGRRFFSPSTAGEYRVDRRYEAFARPEHTITLQDVMELSRYRLEGTPYDANTSDANMRPIGIDRTAQSHFFQIRAGKATVFWLCMANPELSVYLPLYGNITALPDSYALDCDGYTPESAYWSYRALASLAALDRNQYAPIVRNHWHEMETRLIANLAAMDAAYEASGRSGDVAADLFAEISDTALADALALRNQLLTMLSTDTVRASNALGKSKP